MISTFAFIALVAAPNVSASVPSLQKTEMAIRLSAGSEWDTNVNRNLSISSEEPKGDSVMRLLMDARVHHRIRSNHRILWSYVVGAKRFSTAEEEDLVVQNLSLNTLYYPGHGLRIETNTRYRQSRMRSILRDYSLGRGGLKLGWRSAKSLDLWIGGGAHRFIFPTETRLNYVGPFGAAGLSWKSDAHLRWNFYGTIENQYFDGNALTTVTAPRSNQREVTFCDDTDRRFLELCTSAGREDAFFLGGGRITYQRLFILGAEVQFQVRRSNSIYEDVNRIRLSVFGTFELGYDIILNGLAAIQYTSEQSLSQNLFQYRPEDDENQNRVTLQLRRMIYPSLWALIRYELFANAFATTDTAFLRQTVFGGLSFEIDS